MDEFVTKKSIRSKHTEDCSWQKDKTTCDCYVFAPYVPLQITHINLCIHPEYSTCKNCAPIEEEK